MHLFKNLWDDKYWYGQKKVCNAIAKYDRVAVQSGNNLGKTHISAKIALWWLSMNAPSIVVTTAPTWMQVEKLLWGELRSHYKATKISLGGKLLKTELNMADDWYAIGVSTDEEARIQGFHSQKLLAILDEADGIPHFIWDAMEGICSSEGNKMLAIGNPIQTSSRFFEVCKKLASWHSIRLSCLDHPNVKTGESVFPAMVSKRWVKNMASDWGEDSPVYKSRVEGEFPAESDDILIPLTWCESASRRELQEGSKKKLGVDVARFGSNKTAFALLHDPVVKEIRTVGKRDNMEIAGIIVAEYSKYQEIAIDTIGVGAGVYDRCKELKTGGKIKGNLYQCQVGEPSKEPERFLNLRAEIFWNLRDRIKPDSDNPIQLPKDKELFAQLSNIKFSYTSKGQIKLESKEQMTKRGVKSPDKADALAIANWSGRYKKQPKIY